jgi:hypothetical protein
VADVYGFAYYHTANMQLFLTRLVSYRDVTAAINTLVRVYVRLTIAA